MCGRSSLTLTEKQLEEKFGKSFYSDELHRYEPLPNFNIAPTHYVPIVTNEDITHFQFSRWGFLPGWAKDINYGSRLINARIETIESKAAYKSAFHRKRCLIPMSGYYEWLKKGGKKYPYYIVRTDKQPFFMAGIWNVWKSPDGSLIPTFSIITRDAPDKLAYIHNRMPAILPDDEAQYWLDENQSLSELKECIFTIDPSILMAYHVSNRVNSVKNNDKTLIHEVSPPEIQQSLF